MSKMCSSCRSYKPLQYYDKYNNGDNYYKSCNDCRTYQRNNAERIKSILNKEKTRQYATKYRMKAVSAPS